MAWPAHTIPMRGLETTRAAIHRSSSALRTPASSRRAAGAAPCRAEALHSVLWRFPTGPLESPSIQPTLRAMTPATRMPDWLEPMAATLTQDRFIGSDWLFERKFDGIRLLAYKRGADVQLYSRNRLPQNLPALAKAIANLPVPEVILDGEMTWDRSSGYHVFDILWLNGRTVTAMPLEDRRALLQGLPF